MKNNFTRLRLSALLLALGIFIIPYSSISQTKHTVNVTNNVFTPPELSINAGDTVVWTNTQGNHNVNGTKNAYPNNPESFGNGTGTGWTYSHIFNISGKYDYQCDPHAIYGMIGKIEENHNKHRRFNIQSNQFSVYPNPAGEHIFLQSKEAINSNFAIQFYDVSGTQLKNTTIDHSLSSKILIFRS